MIFLGATDIESANLFLVSAGTWLTLQATLNHPIRTFDFISDVRL